jgi:hypothetical protein
VQLQLMLPGRGLTLTQSGSALGAQLTAAVSATVTSALSALSTAAAEALASLSADALQYTTLDAVQVYNFTQTRADITTLSTSSSTDSGYLQAFNVTTAQSLDGATQIASWSSSDGSSSRRRRRLQNASINDCSPIETHQEGTNVTFVTLKVTPPSTLLAAITVTAGELSAYLSNQLLSSPPSAALTQFSSDWSNCFMAAGNTSSNSTLYLGSVGPYVKATKVASPSTRPSRPPPPSRGPLPTSNTTFTTTTASSTGLSPSTIGGIVGGVLGGVGLLALAMLWWCGCCLLVAGPAKKPAPKPTRAEEEEYDIVYPHGEGPVQQVHPATPPPPGAVAESEEVSSPDRYTIVYGPDGNVLQQQQQPVQPSDVTLRSPPLPRATEGQLFTRKEQVGPPQLITPEAHIYCRL